MKVILVLFLAFCATQATEPFYSLMDYLNVIKAITFGRDFPYDTLTEECSSQLNSFEKNLNNPGLNAWAVKLLDASSKVQSGILSLNIGQLGNFDECIKTKAVENKEIIRGKYCLGYLRIDPKHQDNYTAYFSETVKQNLEHQFQVQKTSSIITNMNLNLLETNNFVHGPSWAGCFPSGCNEEDVNIMINTAIERIVGFKTFTINFNKSLCQTENDVTPKLTDGTISMFVFFLMYMGFLAMCTCYDVRCNLVTKTEPQYKGLIAFSFYTNSKKLFSFPSISPASDIRRVSCVDGMKFLSMLWVILGHQYSLTCSGPITNTSELISWAASPHSMLLVNASISVDTFLLIAGLLLMYVFITLRKKGFRLNLKSVLQFYMHRHLRLTPALAAVVYVSMRFLIHMGSGPRWPTIKPFCEENCANYWWSTLLYIQNYFNIDNMCIFQTWYLAMDMQLNYIAVFLFTFVIICPKEGLYLLTVCALCSMICSFTSAWMHDLTALMSNPYGDSMTYFKEYYFLTHTRIAPWFIGAIYGYCLYHIRHKKMKNYITNDKAAVYLWLLSIGICLFCIFVGYESLRQEEYAKWGNVLHITFIRPLWALSIGWMICACTLDTSAISVFINGFYSLPIFTILNRFTYSMYLVHLTIMYMISFSRRSPIYFNDFNLVYLWCGTIMCCMAVSVFWVLAFESPAIALEKLYLTPGIRKVQDKPRVSGSPQQHGEPAIIRTMLRCKSYSFVSTPPDELNEESEPEPQAPAVATTGGAPKMFRKLEPRSSDNTSHNISTIDDYEEPPREML